MEKTQSKVYLTDTNKKLLEIAAKESNRSVSGLIAAILEEYLDKYRDSVILEMHKKGLFVLGGEHGKIA